MKKVALALILLLLAAIGAGVYFRKDLYQRLKQGMAAPADLATRPWHDKIDLMELVTVEFPFPLAEDTLNFEKKAGVREKMDKCQSFTHSQADLTIELSGFVLKPELAVEFEKAPDIFLSVLKTQATDVKDLGIRPLSILGTRAFERRATFKLGNEEGEYRFLWFRAKRSHVILCMTSRKGSVAGEAVWKRMKESIRPFGATPGKSDDEPGLPPGFKRRDAVPAEKPKAKSR